MITIFNGRKLSLDGTEDEIHAQVSVSLRQHIHHFCNGKNLNAFAIFMVIALHIDENGWAFPGRDTIKKEVGLSTNNAISSSLTMLRKMRIEGHRVLAIYRQRDPETGQVGRNVYRIFPDAFTDGMESAPFPELQEVADKPDMGNQDMGNPNHKDNHSSKGEPSSKKKGLSKAKPERGYRVEHFYKDKANVDSMGKVSAPPWSVRCKHCEADVVIRALDTPEECHCGMHEYVLLGRQAQNIVKRREHPAVTAYFQISGAGRSKVAQEWLDDVAAEVTDIGFWRQVVKEYCSPERRWNPNKVEKMLQYYREQRLPGTRAKKVPEIDDDQLTGGHMEAV